MPLNSPHPTTPSLPPARCISLAICARTGLNGGQPVLLTEFLPSSLRRNADFPKIGWHASELLDGAFSRTSPIANLGLTPAPYCWIGYQPSSETTVRASNTYQHKQRG